MRTIVVNLDASVERLAEFRRLNAHMPQIERFPAVDGARLDRRKLVESGTIAGTLSYRSGGLGCALSHVRLWQEAIAESAPITICEDDAIFHHRFDELSGKLLQSIRGDWDVVLWGWNFDSILMVDLMPGVSPCVATFDQASMRGAIDTFQKLDLAPQALRLWRAFGTPCYTVSPSGARRLLEGALPLRPLTVNFPMVNPAFPNTGIDIVMSSLYPSLNAWVSLPPLVLTKNEPEKSTILNAANRPPVRAP